MNQIKNEINEDILFNLIFLYTKDKFQRNLLQLKEKTIKKELQQFIPEFQFIISYLNISIEQIFAIYYQKIQKFDYKIFLKTWKSIILKDLIEKKRLAKLILKLEKENKLKYLPEDYLKKIQTLIKGA